MAGGLNEFPNLRYDATKMAAMMEARLESPDLDERLKDPANWPAEMRAEYGDDHGTASALAHRERVGNAFIELRRAIDDFNPDVVLIWSKEQLENFAEDSMPPFCVYAYDSMDFKPHRQAPRQGPTIWGEDENTEVHINGNRAAAKYLTTKLIEQGFDMAYSYKPLHVPVLAHTFEGLLTHLDWERRGFPYPVVPFYVNGYGHWHLSNRGFSNEGELDPPAPQPWRCFDLGRATAKILRDSPWRVAIIAGSSWSHAHVTPKNSRFFPDVEADRALAKELAAGNYKMWRDLDLQQMIESGRQEILSWCCLAGALDELQLKPTYFDVAETWIFNSTKVTAVFS